jgi:UDPglucose--hexose-1-phosphate uridylyltransferase
MRSVAPAADSPLLVNPVHVCLIFPHADMSDLRHDPIDNIWVTMADNRRARPTEFVPLERMQQRIICPFCKGNESETPPATTAYLSSGEKASSPHQESNWLTRVVANKYPAFSTVENKIVPHWSTEPTEARPFRVNEAHGVQELIIPSPRHVTSLPELTERELELSFAAHRDRLAVLNETDGIQHGMLFMNCRSGAGASLGHIHWQLIGSPVVSDKIANRSRREQQHRAEQGVSLIGSLLEWELQQESRVLRLTDNFCIVCPFASRLPFQVQIIPRDLSISFLQATDEIRTELAIHCRDVVARLESLLDHPAYNVLLQVPVFDRFDREPWYVEIFPRLTIAAGYEWGTDIWVNPVAPETAARAMRVAEENRADRPDQS